VNRITFNIGTFYLLFFIAGIHLYDLKSHAKNGAAEIVETYTKCSSPLPTSKQHESSKTNTHQINNKNNTKMNPSCFDVPARVVLYFLSWSGFLVSFMMRNDVSYQLRDFHVMFLSHDEICRI
jgi:hypothetical protein